MDTSKKTKLNKWQIHLMKFRKSHPELTLKEAMMKAKETYRKDKGK